MTKLTANLIVDAIEPCLTFWVDRLGFEKTVEVPHDGRIGFVILKRGDSLELMLQTESSLAADVGDVAKGPHGAVLYIEVPDLGPIRHALDGYAHILAERTTFYGAREIIARDPGGHTIFFASHSQA